MNRYEREEQEEKRSESNNRFRIVAGIVMIGLGLAGMHLKIEGAGWVVFFGILMAGSG